MRKVQLIELSAAALIGMGALFTAMARRRLPAIAGLGAAGMGITLFFIISQAPDLAMTQFLVEVLSVVLLVVGFRHLPDFTRQPWPAQLGRMFVAGVVGVTMAVLTLVALSTEYGPRVSGWMGEHAYTAAHGRNVVNVILVDFRGLDTFGEIMVLAIAALGVGVLVGRLRSQTPVQRVHPEPPMEEKAT